MAIQAQMADGRMLEFPDGTNPAVIQSTVQRLIAANAPVQQPSLGSPMGDEFGSAIMAAAQPKRESVLQGIDMPEPVTAPGVKPEFIDALQANLNAMPEEERIAKLNQLKQRPGVYGKAASVIEQRYQAQEKSVSPTLTKLTDLRLEPQTQRFMEQGMEPQAAQNLAAQQAMMGRSRPDLQQVGVDVAGEQAKAEAERVAEELKNAGFMTRVGAEAKGQAAQTGLGLIGMYADLTGDKEMQGKVAGATRVQEEAGRAIPKGEGIFEKSAQQAIASAAVQAPMMLLGTVTGTAAPVLLQAGIQSLGSSYGEGRQAGLSPAMAMSRAAPMAAAEVLFERFGMTKALGGLKQFVSQAEKNGVQLTGNDIATYFGKAIASEIPAEMQTTLAQYGIDVLPGVGLNKNPSVGDLYKQLEETLRQTVIQSGAMAGAGAGVVKGAQAIARLTPEQRQAYELDTSIAGTAEKMAREKGFLAPEKQTAPVVAATKPAALATPEVAAPAEVVPVTGPSDLALQRAEEQQKVLDLEAEMAKSMEPISTPIEAQIAPPEAASVVIPEAESEVGSPAKQRYDKLMERQSRMQTAARDHQITNEEYADYQAQLQQAKAIYQSEKNAQPVALSPLQEEASFIADQLESAGQKSFANGMRLNIDRNNLTPKGMDFYRQKLQDVTATKEQAKSGNVAETSSLDTFYQDEKSRTSKPKVIQDYREQAPQKIRFVTDEAEDLMQQLTNRINAAGFKLADVNAVTGKNLQPYKQILSSLSGSAVSVVNKESGVRKGYKNSSVESLQRAIKSLQSDIAQAQQLLNEEIVPINREELAAQPAPERGEVEELLGKQRLAKEDVDILSRRTARGSLMKVLQGSLGDSEMSELAGRARQIGKNPFISLKAKKGEPAATMENMVDSGTLDIFLPENMRTTAPDYVNSESAEYIRDKLRNNQYYTDQVQQDIERVQQGIWDIDKLIEEELSIDDINKEIQLAADEQREIDLGTAEYAGEGEAQTPEERASEKAQAGAISTPAEDAAPIQNEKIREKLQRIASNLGVHVFETTDKTGFYSNQNGYVLVPTEDNEVEGMPSEYLFAHELGHSIMQKRGMMFTRMSKEQLNKWVPGFDGLAEISRQFRPGMWNHTNPKYRRHARKNDEIIADALGSFLLGKSTLEDIKPIVDAAGLTEYDLGLKKFDRVAEENRLIAELDEKQKQREAEQLLKTQSAEELQAKQDEIDKLNKENARLEKEAEQKAKAQAEVGDFVLTGSERAADVAAAKGQQTFLDVVVSPITGEPLKRAPSVTRRAKTLSRQHDQGKISDMEFVLGVNAALDASEDAKLLRAKSERARGADYIRQRLLEAKRNGDLSEEAVDLAEWFILKNPALVEDLGVSIRTAKEGGVGGQYEAMRRIMVLMKEKGNDGTAVHEILHHLERMMPSDMQSAIRKEWAKQLTQAKQKAQTTAEKKFFERLFMYHFHDTGKQKDFTEATDLIKEGAVPYDFYQYVNPSEFWAVNGTEIMQGRFDAIRGGLLTRIKNWLKELAQKIKAVFGLRSNAPIINALDSLSKGDGIFVTDKMLGEAPAYSSIGLNTMGRRPLVNWTAPEFTDKDKFIYWIQNRQIDTKRVVDEITKSVGKIDDTWNPYLNEELFHGRAAKQTKDFLVDELRPLLKEMDRLGVTMPELEEYLHNNHAEEYNEQIANVNPNMQDGGSGIDTADARAYLAALTPEQKATYARLASMVKIITGNTRRILVDSGLESQDTIDTWEKTYGDYVPLNRDDVDYSSNQGMSVGQGYSVKGTSTRRATGSKRKVVDILANIAMQRERTIVRAEKNRVATALYGLALQNANPDFWLAVNPDSKKDLPAVINELINMGLTAQEADNLMAEPTQTGIDPKTGLVVERVNPILRGANNVMAVRVNGKDRFVFFNQNNESANRMVTALKNLDADQLGIIMSNMAKATRFFASINTQFNPVFGVYNFLRDMEGATLQLSTTELAGKNKEVMKKVAPALAGIYSQLRADHKGQVSSNPWSKLWEEFQQEGGQTGFRDQFSRSEERGQALERELKKMSQGKASDVKDAIFNWLSDYNETMENAVRLAAYKAALDNGISKARAASLAKNLTVNFNRKGQVATQANAMYAFFNSAVQGTTRLGQTLKGPLGKTIIAGGFIAGTMQAVLLAAMGFGDEDPPDFIKDKNFIIPLMNGKYLAIPMPLGYNVIPSTARILAEGAVAKFQGKKIEPAKRISHMMGLWLDAFNPVGNAGWSMQTFAPTLFDPLVALFENKDWTGKPIAREDFNKLDPTPGYLRAKETATIFGKKLSEFINYASGGTKDVPGVVSPTPDQIDYLLGQVTGGVGREVMKAEQTLKSVVTGEELPPHKIPLVGRFYGDIKGSSSVANHFYDNIKRMNEYENTIKGMQKRKENVQELFKENPEARAFQMANEVERDVQKLRKRRRDQVEKGAPKEAVKATEVMITRRMQKLNDKIEELERKRKD